MASPKPTNAPHVLIIRDGWGHNPNPEHDAFNAIQLADTPVDDRLRRDYPSTLIHTSGLDVGLTEGTMGNSEVGHQNIGAGRVVDQEAVRITRSARAGDFRDNQAIAGAIAHASRNNSTLHIMGLCSDAGVHSLLEHLDALLGACAHHALTRVRIHCFTDGRDTGPFTGRGFLEDVQAMCDAHRVGSIASVIGRYWAMDRDNRWERVARAHACLTGHNADPLGVIEAPTADDAISRAYDSPEAPTMRGDEFVTPTMIGDDTRSSRIRDNDAVIFFNYRGDRPREIVRSFVLPEFEGLMPPSPDTGARGFDRGPRIGLHFVTMAAYAQDILPHIDVAFPKPPPMPNIAGQWIEAMGLTQFRCAETEKFPHVTFFFNDYRDDPFQGEHRQIIQSPSVATYDLQPEMSAHAIRDAVLERLNADDCEPIIVVNFANPDMVGHTGNLDATIKACETVDHCVGQLIDATLARAGTLIVTADHGNAEQMFNPDTNAPHTAHTTYTVPLIVVSDHHKDAQLRDDARLADILPTSLELLSLEQPPEMTGQSILKH
ncbi:MAG: 2,3-bisphosphoglycerate-independent phosphoglycerate mutase [Planctomycetota bacterium]|jgi:2,3-bisphosphoglycerate-independent phosphoglycerate mutase